MISTKVFNSRAYTLQFKLKFLKLIVFILQIKKVLGAYSGLLDFFVNFNDVEAQHAFFNYVSFLIKIKSTSQTALSGSNPIRENKSKSLLFCNESIDQKLTDALALAGFSMFGLTILFFYQSRD